MAPKHRVPYGQEHLIRSAQQHFKLVNSHSGKLDYIKTIKVWRHKLKKFGWRKYAAYSLLVPRLIYDPKMRNRLSNLKIAPIKVAFERGIWDHFRLVFEKI